jgi:hypothetical protein
MGCGSSDAGSGGGGGAGAGVGSGIDDAPMTLGSCDVSLLLLPRNSIGAVISTNRNANALLAKAAPIRAGIERERVGCSGIAGTTVVG